MILPHLPPTSAFKRALNPGIPVWGPTDYILADLFDVLNIANWQRANQGVDKPSPQPAMYPRPGAVSATETDPGTARRPNERSPAEQQKVDALLAQRARIRARQAAEGAVT